MLRFRLFCFEDLLYALRQVMREVRKALAQIQGNLLLWRESRLDYQPFAIPPGYGGLRGC